jgi:oligopeptide transport system substrate-binding protein
MALDRAKIAATLGDECAPSRSPIPPELEGGDISAAPRFDVAAAKKELAAADRAMASRPLTLVAQGVSDTTGLAKFVEAELRANLGLTVKAEIKSPKDYFSPMNNRAAYAISLAQWTCDFPDPDDYLMIFQSSTQWSYGSWTNEEYDRSIDKARGERSSKNRRPLYERALKILMTDDAAAVPLCHGRVSSLISKRVKGYTPGAMTWPIYRDVSVGP